MSRVLAVGLDAAEPTLVRRLVEQGRMPVVGALAEAGTWLDVEAPGIGSGAVWPTFFTGTDPGVHGASGHWRWNPATMGLDFYDARRHEPFWSDLPGRGRPVGLLDVPFAPVCGFADGFEVHEWGSRDALGGGPRISPDAARRVARRSGPPHPFARRLPWADGAHDDRGGAEVHAACLEGIRHRGRLARDLTATADPGLAVVVFSELHQAGHHLWHAPDRLATLYAAADEEIGRLTAVAPPGTRVVVFALHGMGAARGIPTVLEAALPALGLTRHATARERGWPDRARAALHAAKARAPAGVRRAYQRLTSAGVRHRVAGQTMLPALDWRHTTAFALPSDQHGWIRLNVAGREAAGVVPPGDHDRTCRDIAARLRALTTTDGRPVVDDVATTGADDDLPDLVVRWGEAAFDDPVTLAGLGVTSRPAARELTGNHTTRGFVVTDRITASPAGRPLPVRDVHRLLVATLAGAPS